MHLDQVTGGGTLLVVDNGNEDNSLSIVPLRNALSNMDCSSEFVRGIDESREKVRTGKLSALILCCWKPDIDGIELLTYVRNNLPSLPILVAGKTQCTESRIKAFEAGADNYIMPPYSEREIIARMNRLLKRQEHSDDAISIHDLKVWTSAGVAFRAGRPIKLSSKEMEMLLYLASNRSNPVSRMQILKDVFGLTFEPGTNIVEVHIHRLRQKIDHGHQRRLLNTVRGIGYVLG